MRLDFTTARGDLSAGGTQAAGIAAMAWAWRVTALTSALSLLVAVVLVLVGSLDGHVGRLVLLGLSPLLATFIVTFPLTFVAASQGLFSRSTDRFAFGGNVYFYYGWRYAFRGRTRPWGAMTREEKVLANPRRAGQPPMQ